MRSAVRFCRVFSILTALSLTLFAFVASAESAASSEVPAAIGGDIDTPGGAPLAVTGVATSVSSTGATLNGTVNANGESTTVTFEYGPTIGYGSTVWADQSPVTGSTDTAVSKAITGLTPAVTYHYRVVAQSGSGTTTGADLTFCATDQPQSATTTTLEASPNPSRLGQSVTFTATVTSAGGTPTGVVTFYSNGASLGSADLDGSGVATLTTSTLGGPVHQITATYIGCTSYAPSTSSVLSQNILCDMAVTVTNTNDAGPGSLRQAMADTCADGIIDFALPTYPATITLTSGELARIFPVTLSGPGAENLAISGGGVSRVISASQAITLSGVTIRDGYALGEGGGLWAENGATLSDTAFVDNTASLGGGAVFVDDSMALRHVASQHGQADTDDPGLLSPTLARQWIPSLQVTGGLFQGNVAGEVGGAIISPEAVISNTQFLTNTASNAYAGAAYIGWTALVVNSTFQGNQAATDSGALEVDGSLYMRDCLFVDNHALLGDGGALLLTGSSLEPVSTPGIKTHGDETDTYWRPGDRDARPLWAQTRDSQTNLASDEPIIVLDPWGSMVEDTVFRDNTCGGGGGAICSDPWALLSLEGVTLRENSAVEAGGGAAIASASVISASNFISNTTTDEYGAGGGLYLATYFRSWVDATGLKLSDIALPGNSVLSCRFEGNHSADVGGGLYVDGDYMQLPVGSVDMANAAIFITPTLCISGTNIVSNTCAYGGAGLICDLANMIMVNSTVAGNVTQGVTYYDLHWGTGGGLQLMDMEEVQLANVTIAGNQALGKHDDGGGGIMVYGSPSYTTTVNLTHVTVMDNTSAGATDSGTGGGGISVVSATLAMTNSIVAGNTSAVDMPDISGPAASYGGNLIGDATGSLLQSTPSDLVGSAANPIAVLTGPLGDYGGDTQTVPLLPGSPAINFGATLTTLSEDQRGISRGSQPDSGAFESRGFQIATSSGTPQSTAILAPFAQSLAAAVASAYDEPVDGGIVAFAAPSLGPSALLDPAVYATISGGKASVKATANAVTGTYAVYATIPTTSLSSALAREQVGAQFDLTNLPVSAEATLSGGPATLCPGHNLYYSMVVTNTSPLADLHDLTVTGTVPMTLTEFYGEASPAGGVYNPATHEIVWQIEPLAAGESATFDWTVHTLSPVAHGTVITGSARWTSQALPGEMYTMTATIDTTDCEPPAPEDLVVTGKVYEQGGAGPSRAGLKAEADGTPIPGAVVTATTCLAGAWMDITDADGAYTLVIPGEIAEQCDAVTLEVYAEGYGEQTGTWSVADLRDEGERDWVYGVIWYWACAPMVFK